MSKDLPVDPRGRFTGLADVYARHRPDYPAAAMTYLVTHCVLTPGSRVVDVGCGTGISTRQLAALGLDVIGIEPNADMRAQAEQAPPLPGGPLPTYRAGQAEATSIESSSAAAVVSAQAFHWFDPLPTLTEFHRILQPGGWVALFWNERDETDAATAAYGAVVRTTREAGTVEASRRAAGQPLLTSPLFRNAERVVFAHAQPLDEAGLIGRALSISYAPKEESAVAEFVARLRSVFAQFQQGGTVTLQYETTLVRGQKPTSAAGN